MAVAALRLLLHHSDTVSTGFSTLDSKAHRQWMVYFETYVVRRTELWGTLIET